MNRTVGEASGGTVESSPSVGLAVVDSMTERQIKAIASHAQAFHKALQHRTFVPPATQARIHAQSRA
jgi:hypothetical protein